MGPVISKIDKQLAYLFPIILAIQACTFVSAWKGPWVVHGQACVPHGPTYKQTILGSTLNLGQFRENWYFLNSPVCVKTIIYYNILYFANNRFMKVQI